MLKRTAPAVMLAAIAALVLPASSLADARTRVTIGAYVTGAGLDDYFTGELSSPRASCEVGRKVTVYRKKPGRDARIGSDRSFEGKGDTVAWIVVEEEAATGYYYAKAKKTDRCKKDKSPEYYVP